MSAPIGVPVFLKGLIFGNEIDSIDVGLDHIRVKVLIHTVFSLLKWDYQLESAVILWYNITARGGFRCPPRHGRKALFLSFKELGHQLLTEIP